MPPIRRAMPWRRLIRPPLAKPLPRGLRNTIQLRPVTLRLHSRGTARNAATCRDSLSTLRTSRTQPRRIALRRHRGLARLGILEHDLRSHRNMRYIRLRVLHACRAHHVQRLNLGEKAAVGTELDPIHRRSQNPYSQTNQFLSPFETLPVVSAVALGASQKHGGVAE